MPINYGTLLFNIGATIVIYLSIPLVIRYLIIRKPIERKKAIIIVSITGSLIWLVFLFLAQANGEKNTLPNNFAAILWSYVAFWIVKKKEGIKDNKNAHDENVEEDKKVGNRQYKSLHWDEQGEPIVLVRNLGDREVKEPEQNLETIKDTAGQREKKKNYILQNSRVIIGVCVAILLVGSTLIFFKDLIIPYNGELIAVNGVYHKSGCTLLKYSDSKRFKFFPTYKKVALWNRPCADCAPPYFNAKELRENEIMLAEKKKKEEEHKEKYERFQNIVNARLEERKQRILKQNIINTEVEREWKTEYLKENEGKRRYSRWISFFRDYDLKMQIINEVQKENHEFEGLPVF